MNLEMMVRNNIRRVEENLLEVLESSSDLDSDAIVVDVGFVDYHSLFPIQKKLAFRKQSNPRYKDLILFMEHPPTIDFGRKADKNNFFDRSLDPYEDFERIRKLLLEDYGINFTLTQRPGGPAYLGPGQLIVHPIVNCSKAGIHNMSNGQNKLDLIMKEIAILLGISDVHIKDCNNNEDRRDVYLNPGSYSNTGRLGVKVGSKVAAFTTINFDNSVLYNGFSLFLNKEGIKGFDLIPACGYSKRELTVASIQEVLEERKIRNGEIPLSEARETALSAISLVFGYTKGITSYTPLEIEKWQN